MGKLTRFLDCNIPSEACNLRCHYCYITQRKKFNSKPANLTKNASVIRRALAKDRLGGACLLNFCANGETLLVNGIVEIIRELLLEGHCVAVVTNGTLKAQFQKITGFAPELLNRLFIKFSFHYLELVRLNQLDVFFDNVEQIKASGCSFSVEITPSDELIPHIPKLQALCLQKLGALCHVTVARDDRTEGIDILSQYPFEEYREIWGSFNSDLFDFKMDILGKKRHEFCRAGDLSLFLNLQTGVLKQCYKGKTLDNIYENIDSPLKLEPIGYGCLEPYCYNGHAFLTLGAIPELQTPSYAKMRNRISKDGSEWLQPEINELFSQRLAENNFI